MLSPPQMFPGDFQEQQQQQFIVLLWLLIHLLAILFAVDESTGI